MTNGRDLSAEFAAQVENYRRGQTVFLIDGSGSMPSAYGSGEHNPVATAVSYAAEAKKELNPSAIAFFFGDTEEKRATIPIDLTGGEDPLRRFPGTSSCFIPAFNNITAAYARGEIEKRLHLVIVSDGGIAEMSTDTRDKMRKFLTQNPDVLLDVIVPGGLESDFANMVQTLMPEGDPQRPLVMTALSPEELPVIMAKVLNTRAGTQGFYDRAAHEALNGLERAAKIMSPVKFKKNVVE